MEELLELNTFRVKKWRCFPDFLIDLYSKGTVVNRALLSLLKLRVQSL